MALFTPANNDLSLQYLYTIFGGMEGVLGTSGASISLLGTMFRFFNQSILVVGAFIVVYVTVVGVMATAHEGTFMGKKWNNLWIPIRTVIGIASLVPTGSGYSGLQIIMMWIIVQGIGAADQLWDKTLQYLSFAGSPYAKINIDTTQATVGVRDLFTAIMCAKSAAANYNNPTGGDKYGYFCNSNGQSGFCTTDAARQLGPSPDYLQRNTQISFGPSGSCGKLTYCDYQNKCSGTQQNSVGCLACTGQIEALSQIIPVFSDMSGSFVQADFEYREYWKNSFDDSILMKEALSKLPGGQAMINALPPPPPPPPAPDWIRAYCNAKQLGANCRGNYMPAPGDSGPPKSLVEDVYWPYYFEPKLQTQGNETFINSTLDFYNSTVSEKVASYINAQIDKTELDVRFRDASNVGWVMAGAFYHRLAGMNNANANDANVNITVDHDSVPGEDKNSMTTYRNNYTAAGDLITIAGGANSSGMGTALSNLPGGGTIAAGMGAGYASIANALNNAVAAGQGASNPLLTLTALGYTLLQVVFVMYVIFLATGSSVAVLTKLGEIVMAFGTGGTVQTSGAGWRTALFITYPVLLAFFGLMITFGGTLAVYVPLIPYTIFVLGAISWFMTVVEAMVAGPLVALGIISPSGHHEMLGKAEPGIGLLFGITLRPSLMVFGLISAMLLAGVAVDLVNSGFGIAITSMVDFAQTSGNNTGNAGGAAALGTNPVMLVLILAAYCMLIVSVINKCFELIHVLPNRTLAWIGIQASGGGDSAEVVKGAVSAVGGQTVATGGKMSGRAKAAVEESKKTDKANVSSANQSSSSKPGEGN